MKKSSLAEKLEKLERQNAAAATQLLAIDSPVQDANAIASKSDVNGVGQALKDYESRMEKQWGEGKVPAKYLIGRHFNEIGLAAKDHTSMIIKDKDEVFTHFAVADKYYNTAPENVLDKLKHPQVATSLMKTHTLKGHATPTMLGSGKVGYPTLMTDTIIQVIPPSRDLKEYKGMGVKPDNFIAVLTDQETKMKLAASPILETQPAEGGVGMLYTLKKPLMPSQKKLDELATFKAEKAKAKAQLDEYEDVY